MPKNLQLDDVRQILLSNEELSNFVIENLKSSLASIGFSDNFLSDILNNLINLKVKEFGERWQDELKQRYSIGFFQDSRSEILFRLYRSRNTCLRKSS